MHAHLSTVKTTMLVRIGRSHAIVFTTFLLLNSVTAFHPFSFCRSRSVPKTTHLNVASAQGSDDRRQQSIDNSDPLISLNLNLDSLARSGHGAAPRAEELLYVIFAAPSLSASSAPGSSSSSNSSSSAAFTIAGKGYTLFMKKDTTKFRPTLFPTILY